MEYLNGEMVVTETQAVTSHTPAEEHNNMDETAQSDVRYQALLDIYAQNSGVMTAEQMRDAMQAVCQANFGHGENITLWSIVDTSARNAGYY